MNYLLTGINSCPCIQYTYLNSHTDPDGKTVCGFKLQQALLLLYRIVNLRLIFWSEPTVCIQLNYSGLYQITVIFDVWFSEARQWSYY